MSAPPRRIAHLDMDAFYASVELLRYPELRGQPVIIGGRSSHAPVLQSDGTRVYARLKDYVGRGVTTTSTYEARALGVFSAMGIMKAAKLAPEAILLPTDFDSYRRYSRLFKEAVARIAPVIENRGIDEIYIDLTDHPQETRALASALKQAVREATGLSCSICVAPNKLLAKIGSELDKPDGLTILQASDLTTRIWPLDVKKVNGIGPKATERLHKLGVLTIGDLAAAAPAVLQKHFGNNFAAWLLRVAQGLDDRPVETSSEPKSISRETTFERDLHPQHDRDILGKIFTELCVNLAADLQRKGYVSHTIGVKLRFIDFRAVTRDITIATPTADAKAIRQAARECLRRIVLDKKLRLLGIKASALSRREETGGELQQTQGELF
ncbi:MAG: DNA polymerase IV [Burkholderiales bacterium]|nr:DNA polymerase IV [Burkholderiales bacterium]